MIINNTVTLALCPDGFQSKTANRYKFCYKSGGVNYATAKQKCESNGMRLVEITSEEKSAALDSFASYDYTWLALTCPAGTNDCQRRFDLWVWEYSNKNLAETEGWGTRFIKNGEFIYGGSFGEHCAHWWKSPGHWGPQSCTSTHYGTLCEKGKNDCV